MTNNLPLEGIFFHDFKNSYIPHILKEVYLDGIYQPYLVGKRDLTILDIGGNIGLTSYYFKDFAKIVYNLEPSAQHRACSEAMIKQNEITNIAILPYALSNENGTTKFYHNQNSTMFSMESTVNNINDFEEVETITFDTLFEKHHIQQADFIKLDVEGSESKIFASEGFEKVAEKIKMIIFEYHTWTPSSLANIEHRLQDLGFTTTRLQTDATVVAAVRL